MATPTDQVLFTHPSGITVTRGRVAVPGNTYAVAQITSVSTRIEPPPTGFVRGLAAFCLFGGLVPLLVLAGALVGGSTEGLDVAGMVGAPVVFVPLGVWLYRVARKMKPNHIVIFVTSAGQVRALDTRDRELFDGFVEAVGQAIETR